MEPRPDLSPVAEEPAHTTALKAAIGYFLLAAGWMTGAELLAHTSHRLHHGAFVLLTGVLLYGLVLSSARAGQQARARLTESEQRYRLLADNAADLIWTQAFDGRLRYISPSVQARLGYSPPEAVQDYARYLTPDSATALREAVARQQVPGAAMECLEVEVQHADGSPRWLEVALSPLRGPDDQPDGVLGVGRDITARRAAQRLLGQMEKLEAVGTLAGGVAHDLNNLLSVIMGNIELAQLEGEPPPEASVSRRLDSIHAAAERAAALASRLLVFSRRVRPTATPLDLNEVVQQTSACIREQATSSIDVVLHLATTLPTVAADRRQVEQALLSLVSNACDAMPQGGTLTLETDTLALRGHPTLANGTYVRLRVQDTGVGMDDEVRARAFEPFFTTKPVGAGSGLGLSTAYSVLRDHAGLLELDSRPGRGSTLTALLPAVVA